MPQELQEKNDQKVQQVQQLTPSLLTLREERTHVSHQQLVTLSPQPPTLTPLFPLLPWHAICHSTLSDSLLTLCYLPIFYAQKPQSFRAPAYFLITIAYFLITPTPSLPPSPLNPLVFFLPSPGPLIAYSSSQEPKTK